MTLLITVFAAVISTVLWYFKDRKGTKMLRVPALAYWGASLMWLVDAVFEYIELGAKAFAPMPLDMLNDTYLGLSVTALGLIIWLLVLFINDPENIIKNALSRK